MPKKYWLMKSEPNEFSFDDLKLEPDSRAHWDGVRNYQARNFMRNEMKKGDLVLFYHSNCDPPGVVGIAEVAKEAYPDHTAWDPKDKHFDPKTTKDNPVWFMVEVKWKKAFKRFVSLHELKETRELKDMKVVQRGQRLSVQPVTRKEFDKVCKMGSNEFT